MLIGQLGTYMSLSDALWEVQSSGAEEEPRLASLSKDAWFLCILKDCWLSLAILGTL